MFMNPEVNHVNSEPGNLMLLASVDADRPPTLSSHHHDTRYVKEALVGLPKKNPLNLAPCPNISIPRAIFNPVLFISSLAAVERDHITSDFPVL